MDYSDFVVHIFSPKTRAFYNLERLWREAPRVEITEAV
jgi:ribosome-associated protein